MRITRILLFESISKESNTFKIVINQIINNLFPPCHVNNVNKFVVKDAGSLALIILEPGKPVINDQLILLFRLHTVVLMYFII